MIIEEISKRRSIRNYKHKEIEKEKLERIKKAGQLAPTARNIQGWKIIIVEDKDMRDKLVDAASPHQPFLKDASAILVACSTNPDYIMRCGHPAFLIDLSIVLDHISLQAVKEGLGTCWIGSFYQEKAKKILNIPDNFKIVQLMSLGYPDEIPPQKPRKSLAELYKTNKWCSL